MRPPDLALDRIGARFVKFTARDRHAIAHRRAAFFDVVEIARNSIDMDITGYKSVLREDPLWQEARVKAPRVGRGRVVAGRCNLCVPSCLLRIGRPRVCKERAGYRCRKQRGGRLDEMSSCQHIDCSVHALDGKPNLTPNAVLFAREGVRRYWQLAPWCRSLSVA